MQLRGKVQRPTAVRILTVAVLCALCAACGSPVTVSSAEPSGGPAVVATPSITPGQVSPSPSSGSAIELTCLGPAGPTASSFASCDAEEAAVLKAVGRLGYPPRRVAVGFFDFGCGGPFATGPRSCPVMQVPSGGAAYVSFVGTSKVAAVTFPAVDDLPITASVWVFTVPPAAWTMP